MIQGAKQNMNDNVIHEFFNSDVNFLPTLARKQHWKEKNFSYLKMPRPDNGLMFLLNGRIDFIFKSGMVCAKKGDIIFLPQGSYYEAIFHTEYGDTDNYLINFNAAEVPVALRYPQKIVKNSTVEIERAFKQFVEEKYNCEDRKFKEKGNFYILLDMILNIDNVSVSSVDKTIENAKILLQGNEDMTISQIACRCSVSESGLRRIFKENTGMSPVQYRMTVKISKAKYLLESTDMTISAISDMLNFYDAAHFCRVFQKNTGVTPKKYLQTKKL